MAVKKSKYSDFVHRIIIDLLVYFHSHFHRSVVEFQDAVVQTQLFLGYVDRVRTEYNCLEPYRFELTQ